MRHLPLSYSFRDVFSRIMLKSGLLPPDWTTNATLDPACRRDANISLKFKRRVRQMRDCLGGTPTPCRSPSGRFILRINSLCRSLSFTTLSPLCFTSSPFSTGPELVFRLRDAVPLRDAVSRPPRRLRLRVLSAHEYLDNCYVWDVFGYRSFRSSWTQLELRYVNSESIQRARRRDNPLTFPALPPLDDWWFRGPATRAMPPAEGLMENLPAGGSIVLEIACNIAFSTLGVSPSDNVACPGNNGSYHR